MVSYLADAFRLRTRFDDLELSGRTGVARYDAALLLGILAAAAMMGAALHWRFG